jgi:hypothetical protein
MTPPLPIVLVNAPVSTVAPMNDPAVSAIANPLYSIGMGILLAVAACVTRLRTTTAKPKPRAYTTSPIHSTLGEIRDVTC